MIFLDWDDTILPTTAMAEEASRRDGGDGDLQQQLALHDEACQSMLKKAKQCAKVVIVTAARDGWVQQTCKNFLPKLWSELTETPIVSARSIFEPMGWKDPVAWKAMCFTSHIQEYFRFQLGPWDVISIGDGDAEREALLKHVWSSVPCRPKSIKLMEKPGRVRILTEQVRLIEAQIEEIVRAPYPCDMGLQKRRAQAGLEFLRERPYFAPHPVPTAA
mmetsp:Transcript_73838/g.169231  ORF Transcript_73838/g.169231 Transcript_73838/m.169231 type:complete len:218 (-) Transcript_73838:133-786(-)